MSSSLSDSVNGAHPTATPPASPRPSPEGALVFCSVPPHVDSEDPESPSQPSLGPTLQNRGTGWVGRGSWGPGRSGGCDPSRVGRSRQMPQMGLARQGTEG